MTINIARNVPPEILYAIFENVYSDKDLLSIGLVCKLWALIVMPRLWKWRSGENIHKILNLLNGSPMFQYGSFLESISISEVGNTKIEITAEMIETIAKHCSKLLHIGLTFDKPQRINFENESPDEMQIGNSSVSCGQLPIWLLNDRLESISLRNYRNLATTHSYYMLGGDDPRSDALYRLVKDGKVRKIDFDQPHISNDVWDLIAEGCGRKLREIQLIIYGEELSHERPSPMLTYAIASLAKHCPDMDTVCAFPVLAPIVEESAIQLLCNNCTRMERLDIYTESIATQHLAALRTLTELDLSNTVHATDLFHLAPLRQLQRLSVDEIIGQCSMDFLGNMPHLESLSIADCPQFDDSTIESIVMHGRNLTEICIKPSSTLTDKSLYLLSSLPRLVRLEFHGLFDAITLNGWNLLLGPDRKRRWDSLRIDDGRTLDLTFFKTIENQLSKMYSFWVEKIDQSLMKDEQFEKLSYYNDIDDQNNDNIALHYPCMPKRFKFIDGRLVRIESSNLEEEY